MQVHGWGSQGPILNSFKILLSFIRRGSLVEKARFQVEGIDGQGPEENSGSDFETGIQSLSLEAEGQKYKGGWMYMQTCLHEHERQGAGVRGMVKL